MNCSRLLLLALLCWYIPIAVSGNTTDSAEITLDPAAADTAAAGALPAIDRMPEVISRVPPAYPPELVKRGIEGTVVLDCVVDDSGTVDSVAVVRGVHPALDSAAAAALRQFHFRPAMAGAVPVPVLLQYEIPFTLVEVAGKTGKFVNLQGTLRESGTRAPIADAMVVVTFTDTTADSSLPVPFGTYLREIGSFDGQHLEERSIVTLTDSTGRFRFTSLPAGPITISSPLPGYEKLDEQELISHAEALEVTYYMRRVTYNDYEVVVYGKVEEKEVVRRQLTLSEVRKIPGLGNDAVRVVQAMPGVGRPSFGSGDIIVRGAPTWDSKFYLDGIEIPLLYHFGGLKSIYNPDALESIDFYPGGWSTRYGGAIAGVIEIKGRKPKSDRWHGQVDLNLIDGSILAEGPVNKNISLMVSARRSFIGDLASWYFKKFPDQFPISVTPYYYDILARSDISFSKNNHCFLTVLHSRDSLGVFVPSMQGGSSEVTEATSSLGVKILFTTMLAGWDWQPSTVLGNSFRYAFTPAIADQSYFGYVKVNEKSYMHHFRDELTWTPSKIVKFALGADVNVIDENLALQIPSGSGAINRDTTNNWYIGNVAAYANLTLKPMEHLQLQSGLRYDYYPELIHDGGIVPEYWNYQSFNNNRGFSGDPSLRVSGRYQLDGKHTIKASVGNYNQTPQPIGQVIHKTWGTPTMPTTKAAHYLAGYEWQITDLIGVDLQGYMNRQWDLPRQATEEDQRTNPGVLWLDNGKGRMKGIELMLRHNNNGRFFGWIAYTFSKSERWDPNKSEWTLFSEDETHHLQLLASWHLPREWDAGFRVRYVTGKPTTPVIDAVEYEQYSSYVPVYGKTNSARMDPFFQIDVRIDKKFVYKKWMFSTYLDVQNLSWLFYKSPEMVIPNYDYTDKQTASMIIQPALGVKAEF
jgi:TonB family protein